MHPRTITVVSVLVTVLFAVPAWSQVTVNPGALDQLGGKPAPAAPHATPPHPAPHHAAESKPAPHPAPAAPGAREHAAAHPVAPAAPVKPKPPVVPPAPPPEAVLKPLDPPPPAHPTAPPPSPAVIADAPGEAAPIADGVRVTFGAERADLNAATDEAVQDLAKRSPSAVFNVTAFAPGRPEDPSTPRRLSLSRALAVRSVLINAGIPSTRIYAHAMGTNFSDGPADRVDLTATVAPPVAPAPAGPNVTTAPAPR